MNSAFRKVVFFLTLIVVLAFGPVLVFPTQAAGTTFVDGDVFVAISTGQVQWRHKDGTLVQTLTTASSGYTTGMAFDSKGNLYVTNFSGQQVSKFDNAGNLLGTFGSGYNSNPESIVFDKDGNAYVGHADGAQAIRKYDSSGNFVTSFQVQTEARGSDWIDLADDQCTMYYTSEDYNVKRFNVCTNTQLSNFTNSSLPYRPAYALRILSTGGVMVADTNVIARLDTSGNLIKTYDAPGQDCWFSLNLDPDAKSFWSADFCTSSVYKFDLATGNVLMSFNTGTASSTVWGLTVKGEITAAQPCALPAFGDTNGNPIRQNTQQLSQVNYGGREFMISGKKVFLPFKSGGPSDSIARWGCYLSSGAMIINYYAAQQGISFRTDPAALNDWMSHNITNNNNGYASGNPLNDIRDAQHPDGYADWQNPTHVASAGVDPTTLIQYATAKGIRMAVNTNVLNDPNDAAKNKTNSDLLNTAICNLNPAILGVNSNGHYVTASGKTIVRETPTWRLHDPLMSSPTNLLDGYANRFGRMVIFSGDKPRSAFLLSLYSPAEVVITDPQGRRTGLDPLTGSLYEEIPDSSYGLEFLAADDGDPQILERKVLFINTPIAGEYTLEIIGTGNGQIGLEVTPIDNEGNGSRITISDIVATNATNTYKLIYSPNVGQHQQFFRVLDDFNRIDGAIGTNWLGNKSKYRIYNNQLRLTYFGTATDIFWKTPFGADQEAYVTFAKVNVNTKEQSLLLKAQSNRTWGNGVIEVQYNPQLNTVEVWTYEWPKGWVKYGDDIPVTFVDGDVFGARARPDGFVEVYRNGELLVTRDITAWPHYSKGGYIGLWVLNTRSAILDDFGGGTVPAFP